MVRLLLSIFMLIILGSIASAQSYQIQAGDVLDIEVLEDASLNRSALVLPDGTVTLPLVGSVLAAGSSIDAVRDAIAAGLAPNFASTPTVSVSVASLAVRTLGGPATHIFVIGAVNSPGKIHVDRGTNILQFLAEATGFSQFAATKRIQLRRTNSKTGETQTFNFNYQAIEEGGAVGNLIVLRNNDVIIVPERRLFE